MEDDHLTTRDILSIFKNDLRESERLQNEGKNEQAYQVLAQGATFLLTNLTIDMTEKM
ncbi:hypothetical protein I6N95_03765 [Vagococcus sp. BWB3-3]|uniref:Uncharacterized protein n=1 Tax=Vagococcus allomyrinae TaxID=2794353 RepID=A0A940SQV3_9ENTE|nr:hypothetical protein [Vagococcus allomyrinae]MBP1040122.1 hypothetical protein [Vagococcus allomyrinae]